MQRGIAAGTSVIAWTTAADEVTIELRLHRAAKTIDRQMTSLLEVWLSHGVARRLRRPLRCGRDRGVLYLIRAEMLSPPGELEP